MVALPRRLIVELDIYNVVGVLVSHFNHADHIEGCSGGKLSQARSRDCIRTKISPLAWTQVGKGLPFRHTNWKGNKLAGQGNTISQFLCLTHFSYTLAVPFIQRRSVVQHPATEIVDNEVVIYIHVITQDDIRFIVVVASNIIYYIIRIVSK